MEFGKKKFIVDDKLLKQEVLKKNIFILGPKEMWFGPGKGTAFTSTSKIYGLKSLKDQNGKTIKDSNGKSIQHPIWIKIQEKIQALKEDKSIVYGKPIPGINSNEIWSLRNKYDTLLKDPNTIRNNKKEIKDFNKKVAIIHEALWKRINKSIKDTKGKSAPAIASYLGMVSNDTSHWHKLGAQVVGFSKKITPYKNPPNKPNKIEITISSK